MRMSSPMFCVDTLAKKFQDVDVRFDRVVFGEGGRRFLKG